MTALSAVDAEVWTASDGLYPLRSATGVALIAATVLASMVGFLDANLINVAIPAIGRHFGASLSALQWTLTSYLLTVAALLLLSGALADRFGRRRSLAVGLVVMLVASVRRLAAVAGHPRGAVDMAGLGGVIYALTAGPASGWLSDRILIAAVVGVLSLLAAAG